MGERTPPGFEFSVKLYQKFTHPKMFESARRAALPDEARGASRLLQALATPNAGGPRRVPPRHRSARVRAASSARCSRSFRRASRTRRPRATIWRPAARVRATIRSPWNCATGAGATRIGDTLALLNEFSAAWVQIDEPKFRFSIRQNYLPEREGVLLHAAARPERRRSGGATTNRRTATTTCIPATELQEFTDTADAARRLVKKAYLYTNNHFSAKSVANAAMIKQQLGEPIEGEYPPEFARTLP